MNEVTQARFKGELRKEIRNVTEQFVYDGLLKQALDDFNAAYLRNNAHEASPAEEEAFLSKSYTISSARRETDEIINELTDALIEVVGKYMRPKRWRTLWKILGGVAILPAIHSLLSYAWAGYSYLNGSKNVIDVISRNSVIEAFISGIILLALLIAAYVKNWDNND